MTLEKIICIILFLFYAYGLGSAVTLSLHRFDLCAVALRLGLGLSAIPVLGVILNFLKIPVDWRIFLLISAFLSFYSWRRLPALAIPFRVFPLPRQEILLLMIFTACAFIYCKGAFQYPYLEDDDPWAHAAGIKYIAFERNLAVAPGVFQYINPYPPGYDILFGILHQTSPSLYWTLKFFNAFIVSLSFLFFYYFVKEFAQSARKAIIATFFLATIPCFLSHFIWAHALAVTLFFPAFYCLLKVQADRNYILPGSLAIAGIFLTQPTHSIKFVLLAVILWAVRAIVQKRINRNFILCGVLAVILASLWWGPVTYHLWKGDSRIVLKSGSPDHQQVYRTAEIIPKMFQAGSGTATRSYEWKDFLFSPRPNYINNPIGIGPALLLLSVFGIFCSFGRWKRRDVDQRVYSLTLLGWLLFTFLGVNSMTFHLPIGLFAFRFWMLLAIPVALFAAEGFSEGVLKIKLPILRIITAGAFFFAVLLWSGYPKYDVNTTFWDWGSYWTTKAELKGYIWLRRNLAPNTKVFAFSDNQLVIGHDMTAEYWSADYQQNFRDAFAQDPNLFYRRLKDLNFQYVIIGAREVKRFGLEPVNRKIVNMSSSRLFRKVYNIPDGAVIFKIL